MKQPADEHSLEDPRFYSYSWRPWRSRGRALHGVWWSCFVRTDTPLALRRDRQPSSLTRGKRAGLAVAAQLSSLPFSVAGTEWVGQSNEQAGETPGRQSPPPRTRQLVPAPSIYPLLLHALHDPLWPSSSPHSPRGTYHKSCII